jgi:phosphopantothenoylcysteine decarboxylase/phosphopantothenate--cysteine ligase
MTTAPKVVLGVSGSIAAFKAAQLASDMVKSGMEVRVILTRAGAQFVTPLTFQAITGNPATVEIGDEQVGERRMGHLELARWTEALVVAPASADILARLALGLADDLLTAAALACPAPPILAPAMETGMWQHPATQSNLATLRSRGAVVVGPRVGRLASGTQGAGRMAEPAEILEAVRRALQRRDDLRGLRVLVTAGPTYEPIDPVRFIGNRSSGKMGHAVAVEARDRGAEVFLVAGPVSLPDPAGILVQRVETASQMRDAVLGRVGECDVVVMAAAVADFRPAASSEQKMRRSAELELRLVPTADIAAEAAAANPEAFHVGFALESSGLIEAAREKMRRKGQQLVVANAISEEHNPFGSETNRVVIVSKEGVQELPEMSKREVARVLWDEIRARLPEGRGDKR